MKKNKKNKKNKKINLNIKITSSLVYYTVMTILYIYLIGKCGYAYIWGRGLYDCKFEIILIILVSTILYFTCAFGLDNINSKKKTQKKKRTLEDIRKQSILNSGFIALVVTTLFYLLIADNTIYIDFYNMIPNQVILSIIGLAFVVFALLFGIGYLLLFNILKRKIKTV